LPPKEQLFRLQENARTPQDQEQPPDRVPVFDDDEENEYQYETQAFSSEKHPTLNSVSVRHDEISGDIPADEMLRDTPKGTNEFDGESLDFFSRKNIKPLPATPERDDDEVFVSESNAQQAFETPAGKEEGHLESRDQLSSPAFPTPTVLKDGRGMPAMSSIDAFEASFDTAFPVSFTAPTEDPPPSLDIAFDVPEFSDPFFLGSLDGGGGNNSSPFLEPSTLSASKGKKELGIDMIGKDEQPTRTVPTRPVAKSLDTISGGDSSQKRKESSKAREGHGNSVAGATTKGRDKPDSPPLDLFPESAMSTFEAQLSDHVKRMPESSKIDVNFGSEQFFRTPPKEADGMPKISKVEALSPQRPDKTGAAEARARYDAALGAKSKGSPEDAPSPVVAKIDGEHQTSQPKSVRSPPSTGGKKIENNPASSLVLKRLQQRRASRDKSDGKHSASGDTNSKPAEKKKSEVKILSRGPPDDETTDFQRAAAMNGDYGPKIKKVNINPATVDNQVAFKGGLHSRRDGSWGRMAAKGKLSHEIIGEELRQLDAIASGQPTSGHSGALSPVSSRRRNVKKPISYTEPALNTKLRRGDVFFPKEDGTYIHGEIIDGNEANVDIPDPASEMVDIRHVRRSSAGDVHKDIEGGQHRSTTIQM